MLKKIFKKCYFLVAALFMVTGICLLQIGPQEKLESTIESSVAAEEEYDTTTGLEVRNGFLGHDKVYIIKSAEDLGKMAGAVNSDTTYASGVYYVEVARIDNLSSKFWSPIGTSTRPFKGIFYGNGCVISGIEIDGGSSLVKDSSVGLFGEA